MSILRNEKQKSRFQQKPDCLLDWLKKKTSFDVTINIFDLTIWYARCALKSFDFTFASSNSHLSSTFGG